MKKLYKIIFLLIGVITALTLQGVKKSVEASSVKPSVSANSYAIMDSKTGNILMSQDIDKRIYPASTVKMMTAVLAAERGNLGQKITVTSKHLSGVPSDATKLGLKVGSTYTLDELLHMVLLPSAADASEVVAHTISGSTSEFVRLMNAKAKELGMNSTNFDNTIGLDIGNNYHNTYSTARDIAKLTAYVMKNSYIRKIVSKPTYKISSFNNGQSKTINNTNRFLSDKWYPSNLYTIIGTKTGSTNAAGYLLSATSVDANGREIICMFSGNSTRDKMYSDMEKLLTYTYNNLTTNIGWVYENGNWYYYDINGKKKIGWLNDNGTWYYLDTSGRMQTGWLKDEGAWYYLDTSGRMQTGWLKDEGAWYYLDTSGRMQTGWLNDNGTWYHLESSGKMSTNTVIDGWQIGEDGRAYLIA